MNKEPNLRQVNPALVERCQQLPDLGTKRYSVNSQGGLTYTQAYELIIQAESTGKDASGKHILRHGGHRRIANLNRLHLPQLLKEIERRAEQGENADDLKIALGLMEAPATPTEEGLALTEEKPLDVPPPYDPETPDAFTTNAYPTDPKLGEVLDLVRKVGGNGVMAATVADSLDLQTIQATQRLTQLVKMGFLTKDRPKDYGPWIYAPVKAEEAK